MTKIGTLSTVLMLVLQVRGFSQSVSGAGADNRSIQQPSEHVRASTERMSERFAKAAQEYLSLAGRIQRFVLMDVAFGLTKEEYEAMGGYGVLYVSAITKDAGELPLKDVRLYIDPTHVFAFPMVVMRQTVPVSDDLVQKVFGSYRQDYYILIPHIATLVKGTILCDWNKNRTGFRITETPILLSLGYDLENGPIAPAALPDFGSLIVFLDREFPTTKYPDWVFIPQ